jgi:hypothetical protein
VRAPPKNVGTGRVGGHLFFLAKTMRNNSGDLPEFMFPGRRGEGYSILSFKDETNSLFGSDRGKMGEGGGHFQSLAGLHVGTSNEIDE